MVINSVNSDTHKATVSLDYEEIMIVTNGLFNLDKTDFKNSYKNFDEFYKDFYLLSWLMKDGRLCSDDLRIGLELMKKVKDKNTNEMSN